MLGLFGKKSDHPMANLKAAQQLLQDLPKDEPIKALHELSGWIESVRADLDIRLDDRFAVLRLLDETARPHEIKVLHEYFASEASSSMQEKRLWRELSEFYAAQAAAYHGILVACRDGEKGAVALKDLRQLIVARGVNATVGRLKCTATHYAPVDSDVWGHLAEYFADAEMQDFLDEEIELYPGAGAPLSIRHQLAGVMLWWASGNATLKPQQIHLTERLAAHVCGGLSMDAEPGDDALFAFDLAASTPPFRYNGDTGAHPNLRFIGQGSVQQRFEVLISKLEKGTVIAELDLGGSYPLEPVLEMATRLRDSILSAPPSRRNVRHSIDVNLTMLKGVSEIMDVVRGAAVQSAPGKEWVAEDISATGFRCNLNVAQGAGIKIGSLVGFRPENVQHWGVGIVRRLLRGDQNKLDVGVEVFANRIAGVGLREEGGPQGASEMLGILLGMPDPASSEARVLVKAGGVAEERLLRMRMGGKVYMLMPKGVLEKGDDFDMLRYQMVERSAD